MAQYDTNDWTSRLIGVLPSEWFPSTAITGGGVLYSLASALASNFPFHSSQIAYQTLQTRIATATDANLEAIANDFFGASFPRALQESDANYSARIREQLIAPKATVAAIQKAVSLYMNNFLVSLTSGGWVFAADVGGALDTEGGLSEVPAPTTTIFDLMTDPANSALLGLTPPEFAVLTQGFPLPGSAWFLGRDPFGYLGYSTYLTNTTMEIGPAIDAGLEAVVNEVKAEGAIPVYATQQVVD